MSDNGTNFRLAAKVIQEEWKKVINSSTVQDEAAEKGITWKFIAERAPWRGGFWERLIRIIKNGLRKMTGKKIWNLGQYHTLITEVEWIVNQRPMTFQSDNEDTIPLRPIDFLIPYGVSDSSPLVEEIDEKDSPYYDKLNPEIKLQNVHQMLLIKINNFWNMWRNAYLIALRERQNGLDFKQGQTTNHLLKVGEVVLV